MREAATDSGRGLGGREAAALQEVPLLVYAYVAFVLMSCPLCP